MNNSFREWFVFTKKERTGVVVLVILILTAAIFPYFFSATFEKPGVELTKRVQSDLMLAKVNGDTPGFTRRENDHEQLIVHNDLPAAKKPASLFEFDPNTLSAQGWRALGLRERAIQIIQKYISRGGKFYKPADIKKIYGIPGELALQLIPYVRISMPEKVFEKPTYTKYKKKEPVAFDINAADTTAFMALPGIGSKLANRIITFRDKLGGFHSVEQVRETYGLVDSVFQQVKVLMQCQPGAIQKININAADYNMLSRHPYIGRNLANAIIKYRDQHGPYGSVEDLQKIVLIQPGIFQKIVHYLVVE